MENLIAPALRLSLDVINEHLEGENVSVHSSVEESPLPPPPIEYFQCPTCDHYCVRPPDYNLIACENCNLPFCHICRLMLDPAQAMSHFRNGDPQETECERTMVPKVTCQLCGQDLWPFQQAQVPCDHIWHPACLEAEDTPIIANKRSCANPKCRPVGFGAIGSSLVGALPKRVEDDDSGFVSPVANVVTAPARPVNVGQPSVSVLKVLPDDFSMAALRPAARPIAEKKEDQPSRPSFGQAGLKPSSSSGHHASTSGENRPSFGQSMLKPSSQPEASKSTVPPKAVPPKTTFSLQPRDAPSETQKPITKSAGSLFGQGVLKTRSQSTAEAFPAKTETKTTGTQGFGLYMLKPRQSPTGAESHQKSPLQQPKQTAAKPQGSLFGQNALKPRSQSNFDVVAPKQASTNPKLTLFDQKPSEDVKPAQTKIGVSPGLFMEESQQPKPNPPPARPVVAKKPPSAKYGLFTLDEDDDEPLFSKPSGSAKKPARKGDLFSLEKEEELTVTAAPRQAVTSKPKRGLFDDEESTSSPFAQKTEEKRRPTEQQPKAFGQSLLRPRGSITEAPQETDMKPASSSSTPALLPKASQFDDIKHSTKPVPTVSCETASKSEIKPASIDKEKPKAFGQGLLRPRGSITEPPKLTDTQPAATKSTPSFGQGLLKPRVAASKPPEQPQTVAQSNEESSPTIQAPVIDTKPIPVTIPPKPKEPIKTKQAELQGPVFGQGLLKPRVETQESPDKSVVPSFTVDEETKTVSVPENAAVSVQKKEAPRGLFDTHQPETQDNVKPSVTAQKPSVGLSLFSPSQPTETPEQKQAQPTEPSTPPKPAFGQGLLKQRVQAPSEKPVQASIKLAPQDKKVSFPEQAAEKPQPTTQQAMLKPKQTQPTPVETIEKNKQAPVLTPGCDEPKQPALLTPKQTQCSPVETNSEDRAAPSSCPATQNSQPASWQAMLKPKQAQPASVSASSAQPEDRNAAKPASSPFGQSLLRPRGAAVPACSKAQTSRVENQTKKAEPPATTPLTVMPEPAPTRSAPLPASVSVFNAPSAPPEKKEAPKQAATPFGQSLLRPRNATAQASQPNQQPLPSQTQKLDQPKTQTPKQYPVPAATTKQPLPATSNEEKKQSPWAGLLRPRTGTGTQSTGNLKAPTPATCISQQKDEPISKPATLPENTASQFGQGLLKTRSEKTIAPKAEALVAPVKTSQPATSVQTATKPTSQSVAVKPTAQASSVSEQRSVTSPAAAASKPTTPFGQSRLRARGATAAETSAQKPAVPPANPQPAAPAAARTSRVAAMAALFSK